MMNIFFSITALFAYFVAPQIYNSVFIQFITLGFLIQAIYFIFKKSNGNYVNFYSIFYFSYFFVNFFYALILYPIDPDFFPIFTLGFNENVINKSTALAWVVSNFIILGANTKLLNNKIKYNYFYSHTKITQITGILVIFFIIAVGKDFLSGNFTAQSVLSLYILQLVVCFFIVSSVAFFKNYNYQYLKVLYFFIAFVYIFLFLAVGDRGPALSLLILILSMYSFYVKKINILVIFPILFLGSFLMYVIGVGRVADISTGSNVFLRGLTGLNMNLEDLYYVTSDLSGNSFTLYLGKDYVDENGVNFGSTLISDIIAVFPFFQGILNSAVDFEIKTSPTFFTEIALGKNASWGVGTNLISDVYISFGLIGCIVLFYFFGLLVEYSRRKLIENNTFASNIIYFSLTSYALYLPRAGLFMPFKFIIWSLIIYYFLRSFSIIKPKVIK